MAKTLLDELIAAHEKGEKFTAGELTLEEKDCSLWVKFRTDPQRFTPKVFEGDWANVKQHPQPGKIRLIRVLTGSDEISRVIARQGKDLFAYPWFS